LRFESRINQPPLVVPALSIPDGGMTATTPEGEYAVVIAGISSFDFGAYGKLKVTAEVNGREIVGYWKNDPAKEQKPLLLPKRKPTSWIADKWKEDQGVSDLSDTDDEENEPVGDTHKGDGLSLYEEYRGFSENLKHIRANPKKKDLFVCDRIGNAISLSGRVTGGYLSGRSGRMTIAAAPGTDEASTAAPSRVSSAEHTADPPPASSTSASKMLAAPRNPATNVVAGAL